MRPVFTAPTTAGQPGATWIPTLRHTPHSVLAHTEERDTIYVGSEPATVFRSADGGSTWDEFAGFRAVPEASDWGFHSPTRDSHVRDLRFAPNDRRLPLRRHRGRRHGAFG